MLPSDASNIPASGQPCWANSCNILVYVSMGMPFLHIKVKRLSEIPAQAPKNFLENLGTLGALTAVHCHNTLALGSVIDAKTGQSE